MAESRIHIGPRVAVVLVALWASGAVGDTVLHVDSSARPGGDGLSWATAFRHLQDAFAVVETLDATEIRVGPGLHRPDRSTASPTGTGDRFAAFEIPDGLVLRGGFAGHGADDPDTWDPSTYETVLCGDLLGDDDAPDGGNADNSINVVRIRSHGSLLAGFTITRGNADTVVPGGTYAGGGGISAEQASFALLSIRLTGNAGSALMSTVSAFTVDDSRLIDNSSFGSGLHILSGSTATVRDSLFEDNFGSSIRVSCADVLIERCEFIRNAAGGGAGGAIYNACLLSGLAGDLTVRDCRFVENTAGGPGGAILSGSPSKITLHDSIFEDNSATLGGGAVILPRNANRIVDSVFVGNSAGLGGGAIFLTSTQVQGYVTDIVGCHIVGNTQTGQLTAGGGIYLTSNARITNTIIGNNFSSTDGGGIGMVGPANSNPHRALVHVTIAGNHPDGVAQPPDGASAIPVTHSVIWGNGGPAFAMNSSSIVQHSLIEGGWSGAGFGNIDGDPMLLAPDSGDFRLAENSPAIDAGLVELLPNEPFDLNGDGIIGPLPIDIAHMPRVQGDAPDLGAHEGAGVAHPPVAAQEVGPGEDAMLVPKNSLPWAGDPIVAIVRNLTDRPIAATLVEIGWTIHPPTVGYSEDGLIASLDAGAAHGAHESHVRIPIGPSHVPMGFMIHLLRPTVWDGTTASWRVAPALNTRASAGHAGPVGEFFTQFGAIDAVPALSDKLGDHGVFWDPIVKKGFVWTNVDVSGHFGFGRKLCPADLAPNDGDGVIDGADLGALLTAWGGGGLADLTGDGIVDTADLGMLLAVWGPCAHDSAADGAVGGAASTFDGGPARGDRNGVREFDRVRADLNGDGAVDGADLGLLLTAWSAISAAGTPAPEVGGAEATVETNPADLNGDGVVDGADLGILLNAWTHR